MMRLPLLLLSFLGPILAFSPPSLIQRCSSPSRHHTQLFAEENPSDDATDDEGSDLAAQFFKLAKEKNINLLDDYDDDDDDDDFDDEDEKIENDQEEEVDEFLDKEERQKLSVTDNQIDKEMKERVLETAGGFVDYVSKPSEEDDEDDEEEDEEKKPKEYQVPTKYPNAELTAGEVVELVLNALAHNDNPTKNKGIEIFFAYFSDNNQIKQMELTHDEYALYLEGDDAYKAVFENQGIRIEKGEYSPDGTKAFYTARIQTGDASKDYTPVNFILSTGGKDACWLVDSMLIRPSSMRRRRRR